MKINKGTINYWEKKYTSLKKLSRNDRERVYKAFPELRGRLSIYYYEGLIGHHPFRSSWVVKELGENKIETLNSIYTLGMSKEECQRQMKD